MPTAHEMRMCDRSYLGHAWYDIPDDRPYSERRVWFNTIAQRCERCTSTVHIGLHVDGTVGSRTYTRPDGWKDRWGVGGDRPTTQELRLMHAKENRRRRRTRKSPPQLRVVNGE